MMWCTDSVALLESVSGSPVVVDITVVGGRDDPAFGSAGLELEGGDREVLEREEDDGEEED